MKIAEFENFAWTPEIGGMFTDLKLKVRPFFLSERKKLFGNGMSLKMVPGIDGKMQTVLENPNFAINHDDATLASVIDWTNLIAAKTGNPIPCTEENKIKYLGNMADQLTGHKTARPTGEYEDEPEENAPYLNLFAYISEFTSAMENFEKNLPGTAMPGNNGGSHGAGNSKIIPAG